MDELEKLEQKFKSFLQEKGLECDGVEFKDSDETRHILGHKVEVGSVFYEENQVLYNALNMLDVAGDFTRSTEHNKLIQDFFKSQGYWLENHNSCVSVINKS